MSKLRERSIKFNVPEDRALLIICIGIALIFWLLVKLSEEYFSEKAVVFSFDLPEDRVFTTYPPTNMTAEIEGTGWDLMFSYFSSRKIELHYDLTEEDGLRLNRGRLRGDLLKNLGVNGIRISEVNYENLDLPLEEKLTIRVPVKLASRISFSPNYDLQGAVLLKPDSVSISGPISKLDGIQYWETDSLVLEKLKANTLKLINLKKPPLEFQLSHTTIETEVLVEQITEKSIFVPLTVNNAPDSLQIFPQTIKLTFQLGLSRFNEVSSEDFQVVVDLKGFEISEDKNTAPIALTAFPADVRNVQFSPKSAEFFFLKAEKENASPKK